MTNSKNNEQNKPFHSFDGDQTDAFANKTAHVIEFYHIATGRTVKFKALITVFSDNYDSQWNDEDVYGRMDPIKTFKSTKRSISLGWDVVAGSKEEAILNMTNCSTLFQMMYPTYESTGSSSTLQAPPLFKLKVLNLVQDVSAGTKPGTYASAKDAGLVGSVAGFRYSPNLDDGFFAEGQGTVYPQSLNLECEFSCLHTHPLGYGPDGELRNKRGNFPYNISRGAKEPEATGGTAITPTAPSGTSSQDVVKKVQEERLTSESPGDDVSSQPI